MSKPCITCNIALTTEQWGGCECPVWDCCGTPREVKVSVSVAAAPPALNAAAVDFAPGTVLVTADGLTWSLPANAAAVQSAVAQGVVVCAPIHVAGQSYPANMDVVLRTAETGIYDARLIFPAAFTAADIALSLAVMQSNGFERKQIYA